jgi:hypothetical protein
MKKWSDDLIALSEYYLEIDGTHLKSLSGNFGILYIDYKNNIYTIVLKEPKDNIATLTFKSVDEMIKAGWAVD